jgi:RNA polymerase sporulation-specific sigma factor
MRATDEQLVRQAKHGDERAADELVRRHRAQAAAISRRYFLPGADRDDLEQEALCGLLRAIGSFDGTGEFAGFAMFAVRRQVITAVKASTRLKHGPLDSAARTTEDGHGEHVAIADTLPALDGDPHRTLEAWEELARLRRGVGTLTALERDAHDRRVNGEPYSHEKGLDNACQRARLKLKWAA